MRACGLRPGDVLALSGPNHLDLCIPYYAALYNGLPIFGVDPLFKYEEILSVLSYAKPKIAFCSPDKEKDFEAAAESLHLDIKIITFHRGERTMEGFIKEHSSEDDLINFKAADFEPSQIYAWLLSTSGSMGTPKAVAFTAQVVYEAMIFYKTFYFKENSVHLLMSPVQWLSYSVITIGAALTKATILTSSASRTIDHVVDVINKYKPTFAIFTPTLITQILRHPNCDLMCFEAITVGGSRVPNYLMLELKSRTKADVAEVYGQSEAPCIFYRAAGTPLGSCGKPSPRFQFKLVSLDTGEEINEPNVCGELYLKGPMFSEYFNNPIETARAFSEDGWYKTGDILYRDADGFYFFVERIKACIKSGSYHVYPTEIEEIIKELPDVVDVAVCAVPDPKYEEVPAACVVRRPDSTLTAQEIKDFIANRLSDLKQLHGGVMFVDSLPLTTTGKIARTKLWELMEKGHRE